MEKLTKKQLKGLSKELNAFYCGGNVYNHENIRQYIQQDYHDIYKYINTKYNEVKELYSFLENETSKLTNGYIILSNQIAYSCGVYGNTGQLVQYTIISNNNDYQLTFYTYYC